MEECCSNTSFLEHARGIRRISGSCVSAQQRSAKVKECCSKASFLGRPGITGRCVSEQQKSAKVKECCSKTSFLEHAHGILRIPRNPQKWCDPLLGTSPTPAGGQDEVLSGTPSLAWDYKSCLGLQVLPGTTSLTWDYKSCLGLQVLLGTTRQVPDK